MRRTTSLCSMTSARYRPESNSAYGSVTMNAAAATPKADATAIACLHHAAGTSKGNREHRRLPPCGEDVREGQGHQNRRRAHLGGHRETYEDAGPEGVAQVASADDLHHEVEARGGEERLKGLGGKEMAQLNVQHGHRYQSGGQQPDAPVEQQQPQFVHHSHCRRIRQRRQKRGPRGSAPRCRG